MIATPYLEPVAASLGDLESSPRARPRPLTDSMLEEIDYAADLFRRADKALTAELDVLEGVDAEIDWKGAREACMRLLSLSVVLHIRAMHERERRAA